MKYCSFDCEEETPHTEEHMEETLDERNGDHIIIVTCQKCLKSYETM